MVEPFCRWSGKQCGNLSAAARLSENRYVLCVAAKRGYILVYPLKCCHEVEQAGIAGFGVFVAVGGKVEEAEDVPESSYPSDNIGLVERFLTAEMRPTQEASDGK